MGIVKSCNDGTRAVGNQRKDVDSKTLFHVN